MGKKNILLAYLRLLRLQAGALIASLALIGAVIMKQRNPYLLLIIFIIGLLYHIYLYVLNEYMDLEVDKQSKDLKRKPLVSGEIPEKNALIIAISAVIGVYLFTLAFFQDILTIILLTITLILGGVYDTFGKKMTGISDIIMAGSIAFLFLFGASTSSIPFTIVAILVSL